ncbi:MAG: hypothetical protein AAF213_03050 [Pseudomonadota bacterium]
MKVHYTAATEPDYRAELDETFDELPANLKSAFVEHGWKIKVGKSLADVGGNELDRIAPQTTSSGLKRYEGSAGVSIPELENSSLSKTILLGHQVSNKYAETGFEQVEDMPNVLRHEIGHGIDHIAGRISYSEAFTRAYQQDMADLYNPEKTDMQTRKTAERALRTFIFRNECNESERQFGQKEAFAELSAGELGGARTEELLSDVLPRSRALVSQVVNNMTLGHAPDDGIVRGKQVFSDKVKKFDVMDFSADMAIDFKGWRAQRQARAELAVDKPVAPDHSRPNLGGNRD